MYNLGSSESEVEVGTGPGSHGSGSPEEEEEEGQDQRRRRSRRRGCCCCSNWDHARTLRHVCSRKQLLRKVPILDWLPQYDLEKGVSDFISGITVGLTAIPQGIAYALVAGLPPQYGLYSAFMGCFMYCVFGSCKDVTVGPTAILSLMTAEYAKGDGPEVVVLLAFLSGIIIVTMGVLRLGFVIDFVSVPVIAGFTSAASITIASSQVSDLLGLTKQHGRNESSVPGITGIWIEVVESIDTIRYQDAILGLTCAAVLLLLRAMHGVKWFDDRSSSWISSPSCRKFLRKTVWIVSIARNAIVVIICLGVAYGFNPDLSDYDPRSPNITFILTGNVKGGLPPLQLPPFSAVIRGQTFDFVGMVQRLGSAVVVIPLIALLENVAIAKAFSGGKPVDANQEMIALGLCNLVGSFVSSMPVTGSFSRTAVNASSGVRTTLGSAYTGILVILTLTLLMPACAFIPKATLSAVIITAVIFSVEFEVVRPMLKSKVSDLFCAAVTFFCCLFWALEFGILVGVAIQICYLLYYASRPILQIETQTSSSSSSSFPFLVLRPDRALLFPSVNSARNQMNKAALGVGRGTMPVVVDCRHVYAADFTSATALADMASDFARRRQTVVFANLRPEVEATLVIRGTEGGGGKVIQVVHSDEEMEKRLEEVFASRKENEDDDGESSRTTVEVADSEAVVQEQVRSSPPSDQDQMSKEAFKEVAATVGMDLERSESNEKGETDNRNIEL